MGKIKVGVAGYGVVGQRLSEAVALQKDMELVGVSDVAPTLSVRALKILDAIDKSVKDLNIPTSFKTYGFDGGLVNKMAKESFAVASAKVNCRKVSIEDIEELYRQASK